MTDRPNDPRLRLAAATRRVIEELATSSDDPEAFTLARDLVEQAADVLAARGSERPYEGAAESSLAGLQAMSFVDFSPFVGPLNPLAPPIAMSKLETQVEGRVTYGSAYEGPPGCVHGGFIAAGFDEVLGFTQALSGRPGMTAQLDVSYRSPTPLHHEVMFVGRVDRIEGRKIFASATLSVVADGRRCAEATALFISMKPEVFDRLMRDRG